MHYLIKTVVYSLYNAFTIVHLDIHVYIPWKYVYFSLFSCVYKINVFNPVHM